MARKIVIYADDGAGAFGLSCLREFFERDDVTLATARDIIDGGALDDCGLLVMPGGADLPYCEKLDGAGNARIRAFVETGGAYLGICAGAYYACRAIEFHKGRNDEICAPRELALLDALAIGSLTDLAPAYDRSLSSAAIATLALGDGSRAQAFYHGGCRFEIAPAADIEIVARYADLPESPPAIITGTCGRGRVILSGVHFEISPHRLARHPADSAEVGRHAALRDLYLGPLDGEAVLARLLAG